MTSLEPIRLRRSLRGALLIAGSLFLQACGSAPPCPEDFIESAASDGAEAADDGSTIKAIEVLFDGSQSMAGYVNRQNTENQGETRPTEYTQFLRNLRTLIGERGYRPSYQKFGSSLAPLQVMDSSLEDPSSYSAGSTKLEAAINEVAATHLTLIVTDLFQSDRALGAVFQAIRTSILGPGLTLGVWGMTSYYNGIIGDIDIVRKDGEKVEVTKHYEGNRPFYLLAIGKHGAVIRFLEAGSRHLTGADPDNLLVLSPEVLTSPISNHSLKIRGSSRASYRTIRCKCGEIPTARLQNSEEAVLDAQIDFDEVPFGPKLKIEALEQDLHFWVWKVVRPDDMPESESYSFPPFRMDFEIDEMGRARGANSSLRIVSEKLAMGAFHVVRVGLSATRESFRYPSFCNTWNVDEEQLLEMKDIQQEFDGQKTLNLKKLVDRTWDGMLQNGRLGSFFVYIDNDR